MLLSIELFLDFKIIIFFSNSLSVMQIDTKLTDFKSTAMNKIVNRQVSRNFDPDK